MKILPLLLFFAQWFILVVSHSAMALDGFNHLEQINFVSLSGNRVQIQLNFAGTAIKPKSFSTKKPARIVLDFPNTILGLRKKTQIINVGMVQSSSAVEAYSRSRVVLSLVRLVPFRIEVVDYQVLITVGNSPSDTIPVTRARLVQPAAYNQLVSFNFQNIDVRAVLKLLFDLPNIKLNMVAGKDVHGSITLRLKNVPWKQALDIVLESKGLSMRQVGNVAMINFKEIKQFEPIHTEIINLRYAKVREIVSLLRGDGGGRGSLLSKRGKVSMDERTNSLIIQDIVGKIAEIRELIILLDTPVRQVVIESKIVLATRSFTQELISKFGKRAGDTIGADSQFSGDSAQADNFIVSLPTYISKPSSGGLVINKLSSHLLHLELLAMQSEGRVEILSSPWLITENRREAIITQGTIDTGGTELKVTPQIIQGDGIRMTLSVINNSVGKHGNVSIERSELKTSVLVNNGETIILGGVYDYSSNKQKGGKGFLGNLPLVGKLFKRRHQDDKSELLIFVTPKIL